MSVAGVAIRAIDALVILDVLLSHMTLGLLLAVTHVASSRTSLALTIFDIFGYVACGLITITVVAFRALDARVILDVLLSLMALGLLLAVTLVASRTSLALTILDVCGSGTRSRITITGCVIWALNALVILDVLVSLMTLGLLPAVTHVASRTSLARVSFLNPSR